MLGPGRRGAGISVPGEPGIFPEKTEELRNQNLQSGTTSQMWAYPSPPLSKPPFFLLENDSKAKSYLAGQPRSESCSSLLALKLFALPLGLPGRHTLKRVLGAEPNM